MRFCPLPTLPNGFVSSEPENSAALSPDNEKDILSVNVKVEEVGESVVDPDEVVDINMTSPVIFSMPAGGSAKRFLMGVSESTCVSS